MATYRFDKYESWCCDGFYQYYAIQEKTLFGWKNRKVFHLGTINDRGKCWTKEHEEQQKRLLSESVDRLVKAGNTVL